ncbi:MAG: DUF3052 domain-containing protein [Xanthomonadales bacterium]|nr:DUF3052 domain-containing protein [Xanthomonadales bacterium]
MSGASAGYSGKPVWRKLGLAPGLRVRVENAPGDYAQLTGVPSGQVRLVGTRVAFDVAHVFATRAAGLAEGLERLVKRLPPDGMLWVSWPKKSARVATDITEDTIRALALPLGIVDIKVCAIDATWSGLKFVWRKDRR